MGQRRYVDSSLIIDAVGSKQTERMRQAFAVINERGKTFLTSDYVWLETMPKMQYQRMIGQIRLAEAFFSHAEFVPSTNSVIAEAKRLAMTYGLAAMDSLHAASAIAGGADELITCERPDKPFFRIPPDVLRVVSLYGGAAG
jgi:predicted nucleic acid-binding protein